MNGFLPISKQDMTERGWYYCDFLIVTGDAYVDHPSFGTAIISRVLEDAGYKVAILSQPDFRDEHDFLAMGRPRYAVLINGGNIDSMVAHYTSAKKRRSDDAYTPAARAANVPTAPSPSIPCSHAVPSPIRRSISAASRRACDALRTTTTGRTASCPPFWSLPARTV